MSIMQFLYRVCQPSIFKLDAEAAHNWVLKSLRIWHQVAGKWRRPFRKKDPKKGCSVMGLYFPSRVGLAAGLDKNAEYVLPLIGLGFGFVEVGTVTPRPQPGHMKPRLFRVEKEAALVNRMGFNNKGLDALVKRLKRLKKHPVPIGVNIGKNFDTPLAEATKDYLTGLNAVYPYADYVTVNISSPNTEGLRNLHARDHLASLLSDLNQKRNELTAQYQKYIPIALKISPDLEDKDLEEVAETVLSSQMDGVIATNTTLARPASWESIAFPGGLSGAPLFERSLRVVKQLACLLQGKVPIIAVGGIDSPEKALKMRQAGAELIQIYTGLIYKGPDLVTQIDLCLSDLK